MQAMRFKVGRFGAFLATRNKGAKVREDLERQMRGLAGGDVVEISFARVEAVTVSFADEFIGKLFALAREEDGPGTALLLRDLNDEVREAVSISLERRGAAAVARRSKQFEILGGDRYLAETYVQARALGEFRAGDLAKAVGITPQNANNRLRRLVDAGALLRVRTAPQRGGKEFLYRVPI